MLDKLLLIFCLYLPFQIALNPAEGIDLATGRIFALLIALFWIVQSLKNKKVFIPSALQTLLILSFLFLNAFSLFFAQNTNWSLRKLLFLFSFFPLYFIIADIAKEKLKAQKIIKYLVWGGSIAAGIGIIQFLLQFIIGLEKTLRIWEVIIVPFLGNTFSQAVIQNSSWLVNIAGQDYFRAIAFFPDPHIFSFYLGMLAPWTLFIYLEDKKRKVYLILLFVLLLADLLTFSRGGYVGLLAGAITIALLFHTRINKKTYIASAIALIIIVAGLAFNPVRQRFVSIFDVSEGSNQARIETWKESLAVISSNTWGVGIGNYPLEIKPSADYREPIYSHNLYMDIAAESGIINALVWISLIIFSGFGYWKKYRQNLFYGAGLVSLAVFSAHSIFETALFSVHILPLIIIFIALSTSYKNET